MKNVFILMLGLVASTASFATTNQPTTSPAAQTRLEMTPGHKIKLHVQPLQTKGQLSIQDTGGQAIFTETVSLQKGLHQQFDVSGLGTGTYRLTLVAGTAIMAQTFVVQADPNASFIVQKP